MSPFSDLGFKTRLLSLLDGVGATPRKQDTRFFPIMTWLMIPVKLDSERK